MKIIRNKTDIMPIGCLTFVNYKVTRFTFIVLADAVRVTEADEFAEWHHYAKYDAEWPKQINLLKSASEPFYPRLLFSNLRSVV